MKWLKKWCKREIDERQQADLNRVTSAGYWMAFYLLLLAIIVEGPVLRRPFQEWAVEWGIFMILAFYEVIVCIRIGVWAPNVQNPSIKGCAVYSMVGGALFAAVITASDYLAWEKEMRTVWNVGVLFLGRFLWMTVAVFAAYLLAIAVFMRRRKKMEDRLEKEDVEDEGKE